MKTLIAAALTLSLLGSCASPAFIANKPTKPPTVKVCAAKGEHLGHYGMFAVATCVKRFADAGKVCRNTSDCIGGCVVELGTVENRDKEFIVGQTAEGQCARESVLGSCVATIDGGKVTKAECVD